MGAEFQKLGEAAIEAAAANPRQLITALNGAETSDITDVAVRVNRNIENSQFPETIVDRLVVATAISVAKAGKDAPIVAVALLKETKKHHAIIAATAVLVSGEYADEVIAALLEAAPADKRDLIEGAVNNPIQLALGHRLSQLAINSAVDALATISSTSDRLFDLPGRKVGGIPGEVYVPRGEFYFGQRIFDSSSGRYIRPAFGFTDSTFVPSNSQLPESVLREQQTLPFDNGFITDRGTVFPQRGTTAADRPPGANNPSPHRDNRNR